MFKTGVFAKKVSCHIVLPVASFARRSGCGATRDMKLDAMYAPKSPDHVETNPESIRPSYAELLSLFRTYPIPVNS